MAAAAFRLGINCRFLAAPVTGVQRFAREVVRRLGQDSSATLFLPAGLEPPDDVRCGVVRGTLRGHAWEQLELPRVSRGCDVLLYPANTGPLTRTPFVLMLHDVLPLTDPSWFDPRFALWQRATTPRVARAATRIVTVSEWSRRAICRATGAAAGRIAVAPQGLTPFDVPARGALVAQVCARFRLPPAFLLAVGGDTRKNSAFLVSMLERWAARHGSAPTLVVAGAAQPRVHRATGAAADGVDVRVLGRVTDDEMHALYTAAQVLCFPSLAEGFGRPPLEAVACGTPAVAAPYAAAAETLAGLAAVRVVPLDPDAWIHAVRQIANVAPALIADDAVRLRARWTWDAAASVVLDACAAAAGTRASRAPAQAAWRAATPAAPIAEVSVADRPVRTAYCATPRIAIVHDWLTGMRGGERVLLELLALYPQADVLTLVHVRGSVHPRIEERVTAASFVDRLPFAHAAHRLYLPLYPAAIGQLDVSGYDLVISSSHCAAKGVSADVPHLCYCHTPMRYAWDQYDAYFGPGRAPSWLRAAMPPVMRGLRRWDVRTAAHVDAFIANSAHVRDRIRAYYGRDATVIYPPVDTGRFRHTAQREDFYLIVSALVPYKRVDLAVAAFNQLRRPLVVVGEGPERQRLQLAAGPAVSFLGRLPDDAVADLLARCRAFIFPGTEDFGMTPVEAQAAGAPVVAFAAGGALETVSEPATGVFFAEPNAASLAGAVRRLDGMQFDCHVLQRSALRFSPERFRSSVGREVDQLLHTASADRAAGRRRLEAVSH
ncbi:MAG: glycosyltransferase [Gemmatimonadota bacterium]